MISYVASKWQVVIGYYSSHVSQTYIKDIFALNEHTRRWNDQVSSSAVKPHHRSCEIVAPLEQNHGTLSNLLNIDVEKTKQKKKPASNQNLENESWKSGLRIIHFENHALIQFLWILRIMDMWVLKKEKRLWWREFWVWRGRWREFLVLDKVEEEERGIIVISHLSSCI